MGSPSSEECEPLVPHQQQDDGDHGNNNNKKLSLIPLIFLIYFEVSGGPYGEEVAVGAAGPLLALAGYVIFPFIWSVPEALVTAELATAFPGNGGFVVWAHRAFGPFCGSMMGTWKFLSGAVNLASYPVLCADYLQRLSFPRLAAVLSATLVLSLLNFLGLSIVGHAAVALGVVSYAPFLVMAVLAAPRVDPARWLAAGSEKRDWSLFLNGLFWSLNCWDSASTLAGEVRDPQRTYPKALLSAVVLTSMGYLVPLMAAIGAVPLRQEEWRDGYLATAAGIIGGKWLEVWVGLSTVLSVVGMFEAQLTTIAYQVVGMAELGILPRVFATRSIYSMGMVLEFASFVRLRMAAYSTSAKRPFRVPVGLAGAAAMCVVPTAFVIYVMAVATTRVLLISASLTAFAVAWYFFMNLCRSRMWFAFNKITTSTPDQQQQPLDR